jgi:hypothetical protein
MVKEILKEYKMKNEDRAAMVAVTGSFVFLRVKFRFLTHSKSEWQ